MASGPVCYAVNTSSNSKNFGVFCNSDGQCCVLMKSEIQALENELKSLIEIINILKDETKSVHASKEDCKFTCTSSEKCITSPIQSSKCVQLESQLEAAYNEASSFKLIMDMLSDECKSMKQSAQVDRNSDNLWSSVKQIMYSYYF